LELLEYENGLTGWTYYESFRYDPLSLLSAMGRMEVLTYFVESIRTRTGQVIQLPAGTTLQHLEEATVTVVDGSRITVVLGPSAGFNRGFRFELDLGAAVVVERQDSDSRSFHVDLGELVVLDSWDDVGEAGHSATISDYWAGREDAYAAALWRSYASADAWGVNDWAFILMAAQDTFGNAVFQQPLRTLGTGGFQVTALVGTAYAGVAAAPHVAGALEAFNALPPQAKAYIIVGAIRLSVGAEGEHTATNLAARRVLSHTIAAETAAATARQASRGGAGSPLR
jgi:hypothetical protein